MPHEPQAVGSCLDNAKRSAVREGMLDSARTAPRNYDGASKPLSLTAGSKKIMKLLIDEHPLMVLPGLAKEIGLNEAIVLQQIHYWTRDSRHVIDGYSWTYNSVEEWQKQFPFWSNATIRRVVDSLVDKGLLLKRKLSENRFDATLWYAIDTRVLSEKSEQIHLLKMSKSAAQNEQIGVAQNEQITSTETTKTSSKTSARSRKTSIPENFGISSNVLAWAKQQGHDNLVAHLQSFVLKCKAKGYQYVDWDSAFMEAIRKDWAGLKTQKQFGKQAEWDAAISGFLGASDDPYTLEMEG